MATKPVILGQKNGDGADLLLPHTSADLVGYENAAAPGAGDVAAALDALFEGAGGGISELPTASVTQAGITKLNDSVTSTSTSEAATANAVKTSYDKAADAESAAEQASAAAADWTASKPGIVQRVEALEEGGMLPKGVVLPFYRVTLGGSDNRRPIFWGNDEADEGWVLCDGGSDGDGGVVPDLRGRMILGASDAYPEYSGGGSASHTHTVSGTVGATTLSQAQMPSHTHQSWAGRSTSTAAGIAVTPAGQNHYISDGIGNTGGNGSHTHSLANAATGQASSMPPYYALSYFVKI